jgi:putative transposase
MSIAVETLFTTALGLQAPWTETLKYRPVYPQRPFANLLVARHWVGAFVHWYNEEHRHSAIRFVTPAQRHAGLDVALLRTRQDVYEAAKLRRPERWSGPTRSWKPVFVVHLNPDKAGLETANKPEEKTTLRKAA